MDWRAEVVELHDLFDAWFRDGVGSLDRFEATMDPSFTIISPSGRLATAAEIVEAVRAGRGRAPDQQISTGDHELLLATDDVVVARYVEQQRTATVSSRRWSTVVFRRDRTMPNGVRWLTVHETWLAPPSAGVPSAP